MMSTTVLYQISSEYVEAVRRAYEGWRGVSPEGRRAQDLPDLIRACLEFPAAAQRLHDSYYDQMLLFGNTHWTELGESLLAVVAEMLALQKAVLELEPVVAEQRGNGWNQLCEAQRSLEELREKVRDLWPWAKTYTAEELRAATQGGDFRDVDDAFAELMGVDQETLLKRLEEHKRRYHPRQGVDRDAV